MLYRLILQMDPVAQLQLYKTAAEADAWTTLQITIDANAPALALALVAQRAGELVTELGLGRVKVKAEA